MQGRWEYQEKSNGEWIICYVMGSGNYSPDEKLKHLTISPHRFVKDGEPKVCKECKRPL